MDQPWTHQPTLSETPPLTWWRVARLGVVGGLALLGILALIAATTP